MNWGVGLYVGNTYCTAVIAAPDAAPVVIEHESVLHHAPDGTIELGEVETNSPGVRRFLDRVPSDSDTTTPSHRTRGEDLVATALYCLVQEVSELTDQPLSVIAAIPPNFTPASVELLRIALDNMDLDHVELIPQSDALDACDSDPYTSTGECAARGAAILAVPVSDIPLSDVADSDMANSNVTGPGEELSDIPIQSEPVELSEAHPSRRPLVIATSIAGLLTAAGCAVAIFIGYTPTTQVPEIHDGTVAVRTEAIDEANISVTPREVPIQFPTGVPATTVPPNINPAERQWTTTPDSQLVDEFDQVPTAVNSSPVVKPALPTRGDSGAGINPSDLIYPGTVIPGAVIPGVVIPGAVIPGGTDTGGTNPGETTPGTPDPEPTAPPTDVIDTPRPELPGEPAPRPDMPN
ncbi:hypothetical protein [Rhodococcus sp. OK302]|uniref:hypothetical protein n=1 Tax=Rhodococcus sp. OK302 TaxID=1882769 RepID=UPI000B9456DB|nr:hypothetical protein [Rhodococcus sp. OK302]OYD71819.1 hypothetical protein BDB13_5501 [Rhodococcus sp. OK302]